MIWVEFGLALLKTVLAILSFAERNSWINAGRQQVIAELLVAIADKVKVRDQIRAKIEAMSDAEVDDELLRLGHARDVPPSR